MTGDEQPLMDTMSVEEARMIWLTMLGSDWVDEDIFMDVPSNSPLDAAAIILDYEALLEHDHYRYRIKLRCKS